MSALPVSSRAILGLAWPVILTNLLSTGVQWVDLLMVATLGKVAVAAVGLSSFILTLGWAILFSVQTGTSVVVAQAFGADDRERVDRCVHQSLLLGCGLGSLLTVLLCWPGSELLERIFRFLGAEPEVVRVGAGYLRIVLLMLIGLVVSVVGQAALRSTGDTRTPLWITGGANLLNVLLNYMLIFGELGAPALGVSGAAWGTLIARGVEAMTYLVLLAWGRLNVRLLGTPWRPDPALLRSLLRFGWPAALEQLVFNTGFLLYNRIIAAYGTEAIAAYQIGVVLLQASFMPGFGFSVAATTLVGQWQGAGDSRRARRAGDLCRNLALVLMPALGALFFLFARPFARFVLDDPDVVPLATGFIRYLAFSQPLMAVHFALSGALRGAGDVRSPLLGALIAMYGIRLPLAACSTYWLRWPLDWVWWAMVIAHLAQAAVLSWRWQGGRWREIDV